MSGKTANHAPNTTGEQAVLLVAIAILLGVVAGEAGAILAVIGGSSIAAAVKAGAVTFSGTVTLVILILLAIRRLS
jgi:hypothetical protein